jgi:hypothetical protein
MIFGELGPACRYCTLTWQPELASMRWPEPATGQRRPGPTDNDDPILSSPMYSSDANGFLQSAAHLAHGFRYLYGRLQFSGQNRY